MDDYERRRRERIRRREQEQRRKREPLFKRLRAGLANAINKAGTLNIVLLLVFGFFLFFNYQMLQLFRTYGTIPETYACAVVAATIGECGICGWIRTNKDRKREHDWQQEEEQRRHKDAPAQEPEDTDTIQEVDNG